MESSAVKFYIILTSALGLILIHLLLFAGDPLVLKSCSTDCYLTGWPFGSYEHAPYQVGSETSVSALGWLLNSFIGVAVGAGLGSLIGNHLVRKGQAISFPVAVPEKECLDRYRNGSKKED